MLSHLAFKLFYTLKNYVIKDLDLFFLSVVLRVIFQSKHILKNKLLINPIVVDILHWESIVTIPTVNYQDGTLFSPDLDKNHYHFLLDMKTRLVISHV